MTTVIVHPDAGTLAAAIAARLISRILDAQAARGSASIVLTGGTIGVASLAAVKDSAARDAVDWSLVDVWWGDERFVTVDDPERNDRQAREALLDVLPLDPARVHPMGALGAFGTPEAAAEAYVTELEGAVFDVLMLGMGPEGHIASIFPSSPAVDDVRPAFAVHDCPKPPPTRISLSLGVIQSATDVWLLVSGEGKAEAVARAVNNATPVEVPAAGAVGREQTLWLIDKAAASEL